MHKRWRLVWFVILSLLCVVRMAMPQNGSFTFVNESNVRIDRDAVQAAAQPLINKYNADVAVYAVVSGSASDFRRRLQSDGLITGLTANRSRSLAIYFATEERYSEIRWGSTFDRLDGDNIRSEALNPGLRSEDFTGAVVNTFNAVDSQMSDSLLSIKRFFGRLLNSSMFWFALVGLVMVVVLIKVRGFPTGGSGSSTVYHDSSSSWSGSDSGGSSSGGGSSGGGSSGGSWDD